jgi:hypothetical protein
MLLFGEELRLPTAIDAKVQTWHDHPSELYKLYERRRLVEEIIKRKKLEAYEESERKLEYRLASGTTGLLLRRQTYSWPKLQRLSTLERSLRGARGEKINSSSLKEW